MDNCRDHYSTPTFCLFFGDRDGVCSGKLIYIRVVKGGMCGMTMTFVFIAHVESLWIYNKPVSLLLCRYNSRVFHSSAAKALPRDAKHPTPPTD